MNESRFLGTGWSFPPTFEQVTQGLVTSSKTDNINQSINIILQTPRASRPLQPEFGCDLQRFLFKKLTASLQEEIVQSVKTSLLNDEPRIVVDKVETKVEHDLASSITLYIYYTVKQTNSRHNYVYPFSLQEGTNLQASP